MHMCIIQIFLNGEVYFFEIHDKGIFHFEK